VLTGTGLGRPEVDVTTPGSSPASGAGPPSVTLSLTRTPRSRPGLPDRFENQTFRWPKR